MASMDSMQSVQTSPKYIYKIAPPHPKPDTSTVEDGRFSPILPPSDLDISSNFIHMSTASQVLGTLERFFPVSADVRTVVYLIRVELGPFENRDGIVRWESPDAAVCGPRPGEGLFPHLYFEERRLWLRKDEIDTVREVVVEAGVSGWSKALDDLKEWLV